MSMTNTAAICFGYFWEDGSVIPHKYGLDALVEEFLGGPNAPKGAHKWNNPFVHGFGYHARMTSLVVEAQDVGWVMAFDPALLVRPEQKLLDRLEVILQGCGLTRPQPEPGWFISRTYC